MLKVKVAFFTIRKVGIKKKKSEYHLVKAANIRRKQNVCGMFTLVYILRFK